MTSEPQNFSTIELAELMDAMRTFKEKGYRFVQSCAVITEDGFELTYSFDKDFVLENVHVIVPNGTEIESVTSLFPAAFVFENEMHDLFGIDISGISIDFAGKFYSVSVPAPMASDTSAQEQKAGRF